MKIVLLVQLLISLAAFRLTNSKVEYVCLPCGQDCDKAVYTKPGQCSSCGMKLIDKSTIKFSNISVDELCTEAASDHGAVLLDVRSPEEFKGTAEGMDTFGHFKNAVNINVTELENRVQELNKYKTKEILVYCSHAHRSAVASYFLTTHGFDNVKNMTGGVSTIDPQASDCLQKFFVKHNR